MAFGEKPFPKGRKPMFTGSISDLDSNKIYKISLWITETGELWFQKLAGKE